jgi:sugar lactone lactonase YvrE
MPTLTRVRNAAAAWPAAGLLAVAAALLAGPPAKAQSTYATPYTFTTLAGPAAGAVSVDGLGVLGPSGVAVDAEGYLYVACTGYSMIRKVAPSGLVSPLAGIDNVLGSTDGVGSAATFNRPLGIGIDTSGNVYVADTGNNTVRKITPAGLVSTFAGTAGIAGSADGTGAAAQFNSPCGIAVDAAGNVYVSEGVNCMIRKITPAGAVSTLAGAAGAAGSADGTGPAARFDHPAGLAVDGAGNLYVADYTNDTIRKVTAEGVVTTLAGYREVAASADGTGSAARFWCPAGVALDAGGTLYVADSGNNTIRAVTPAGVVTTLAGTPGNWGAPGGTDGTGAAAAFAAPLGIAVGADGTVYVADTGNAAIRKGVPALAPRIQAQPASQFAAAGASATFSVTASGSGTMSYQWSLNGSAIPGATGPTYTVASAQAVDSGAYTVTVADATGSVTSGPANLYLSTSSPGSRLVNISTRARVGTGGSILIPGFVVGGSGSETLLIRAAGPGLTAFGVPGALAAPSLTVTAQATGAAVAANTGWGTNPDPAQIASTAAQVGAFALASGSLDCAVIVTLQPGAYTVQVSGAGGTTGVALAEVYEVAFTGTARLVNLATRAQVGTGGDILISGFVVGGSGTEELLVRADGPGLAAFGVSGLLAQPSLSVITGAGAPVGSNTQWGANPDPGKVAAAAAFVGAFPLAWGSADSAATVSLPPGAYTMQASGAGGTTGIALAEVYVIP